MSHPCDGHACDHCYLCDVVGICCASVPAAGRASHSTSQHLPDVRQHDQRLLDAIVAERQASRTNSFEQQVRAEVLALPASARPALPPPSSTRDLSHLINQRRKEQS